VRGGLRGTRAACQGRRPLHVWLDGPVQSCGYDAVRPTWRAPHHCMVAALCEHAASCVSACGAGVPPLPPITSVMGPSYRNYTWMYDSNFVIRSYSFSNLDWVPARPPARAHAPRVTEGGRACSAVPSGRVTQCELGVLPGWESERPARLRRR